MTPPSLQRRFLLREMEARGIRMTSQRRVLIETIQAAESHLNAAQLLERWKKRDPRINRATVYRTLELLKKLRLIDELDLMTSPARSISTRRKPRSTTCIWHADNAAGSKSSQALSSTASKPRSLCATSSKFGSSVWRLAGAAKSATPTTRKLKESKNWTKLLRTHRRLGV